jgi:hypothetical protein
MWGTGPKMIPAYKEMSMMGDPKSDNPITQIE